MLGIRKNQANLTKKEKDSFVDALIELKSEGTYDKYVLVHMQAMMHATPSSVTASTRNSAHKGPAFLPWHREYLRKFELELKRIDPSINLPYWDWTVDNSTSSSIFSDDFMGGDGNISNNNIVETGKFAYSEGWELVYHGPALRRSFETSMIPLPNQKDVDDCLAIKNYDSSPWDATSNPQTSFRNTMEGWLGTSNLHNSIHSWVGGSMTVGSSPNDPLFFLHHCNIDRIWAMWQKQSDSSEYLPQDGTDTEHNVNDPLFPWGIHRTPASVLNIRSLGYSYDTSVAVIPDWVKANAGWWADGVIDDDTFATAIRWMIKEGSIKL